MMNSSKHLHTRTCEQSFLSSFILILCLLDILKPFSWYFADLHSLNFLLLLLSGGLFIMQEGVCDAWTEFIALHEEFLTFPNQNSSNFFNLKLSRMPHKSSISSTRGRVEKYNKLRSLTLLTLLIPIWFFILIILFWKEKETWSHEKNSIRTIIEFLSMTKMWISSLN